MANMFRSRLGSSAISLIGDALPEDVLEDKTFMNENGAQTGAMTNNGAVSGTATPTQPYTIPEGYHNGSGVVTANDTEFVSVNKLVHLYAVGVIEENLTSPLSVGSYNCYIINVSNKSSFTANSGQLQVAGAVNSVDDMVTIRVTANTAIDISAYKYLLIHSSANASITFA